MNPPCEIVVEHILPVIRSALAKELIQKHGFTQQDVAEMLNLTQPAVSQYLKEVRGKSTIVDTDYGLKKIISDFAEEISEGKVSEFGRTKKFCEICSYCRKTALICKFHPPKEKSISCDLCLINLKCD